MKLIVGLGNPGKEYVDTRHNMGRRLMEFIAAKEKVAFNSKKSLQASLATVHWAGEPIHVAYPLTYMNLSGEAVKLLVTHFGIKSFRDLLIVVDDVALPFGKFRLRGEGSAGGHNGLASIEEHLGSEGYPRLRMGIGTLAGDSPHKFEVQTEPLKDYVLSLFEPQEEKHMEAILVKGMQACRSWALEPLARAMNWVNAAELP
ncbi:MAG TPA: aminoacyl-tRNA hydrolase [Candidatus Omnitrophota bacterium]|nr:aminoacyl-tRNA hydrolase [Candidatus Omnitrophota bacterium]